MAGVGGVSCAGPEGAYFSTSNRQVLNNGLALEAAAACRTRLLCRSAQSTIQQAFPNRSGLVYASLWSALPADPLHYFLKILANAGCYGIYAEVNRVQVGKNDVKKIKIFSGDLERTARTCAMEMPGPWYFPPVASLITAGGRLL